MQEQRKSARPRLLTKRTTIRVSQAQVQRIRRECSDKKPRPDKHNQDSMLATTASPIKVKPVHQHKGDDICITMASMLGALCVITELLVLPIAARPQHP